MERYTDKRYNGCRSRMGQKKKWKRSRRQKRALGGNIEDTAGGSDGIDSGRTVTVNGGTTELTMEFKLLMQAIWRIKRRGGYAGQSATNGGQR